jgi:AcrR family transcriptional regulator
LEQLKPYHHGALRDALLAAAESILRRDGLPALTLRAIAREAGVSHGAPGHHFKDLSELLSELAALGFERLTSMMQEVSPTEPNWRTAASHAYVAFAIDNPGLFSLMFRVERLNADNPRLSAARQSVFGVLVQFGSSADLAEDRTRIGAMTAQWCLLHGYAVLAIDGRLARLMAIAPPGTDTMGLLDFALTYQAGNNGLGLEHEPAGRQETQTTK